MCVYIHVNFINITVFTLCTVCREVRLFMKGQACLKTGRTVCRLCHFRSTVLVATLAYSAHKYVLLKV